ncbi:unnamed protein product [Notodromas monacha]|uniref:Uncharacterized protein n=1 Tax=Notodromas monacha TaxID=399045 RepID=A0A7R9BUW5_9CRUS|nr:unnamed protein product [Notodromas monacha]CAG0921822.1 unnamed protein product [Notodromas monacha]
MRLALLKSINVPQSVCQAMAGFPYPAFEYVGGLPPSQVPDAQCKPGGVPGSSSEDPLPMFEKFLAAGLSGLHPGVQVKTEQSAMSVVSRSVSPSNEERNHRCTRHFRSHQGHYPFSCPVCQKGFRDKSGLKRHYVVHTGEHPCKCQFCGKGFAENAKLNRHLQTHTGEYKFKCLICDKGFTEHVEGFSRHSCNICGKQFTCPKSVQRHISDVHKPRVKREMSKHLRPSKNLNPVCIRCELVFKNESDFRDHAKIHRDLNDQVPLKKKRRKCDGRQEPSGSCPICGKEFTRRSVQFAVDTCMTSMEVTVGTYEGFVLGYKVSKRKSSWSLKHVKRHLWTIHQMTEEAAAASSESQAKSPTTTTELKGCEFGSNLRCVRLSLNYRMEVTVGTYEGFVLGYKVSKRKSSWSLKIVFADKCHMNAVKTVASSGPIIASGSIDETIAVFNILKRKCVTVLQEHSATVTSIRFHGKNAFTCSEDGRIVVWDSKNWLPKAELPGHVGAVKDFAVHPSGKLGLSVGQDKTLRTWNLLKGRNAYVTNIKAVAHLVVYSPDGRYYAIALHDTVEVFSIETAGSVQTLRSEAERRISDLKFTPDGKEIVFSSDSPTIEFHDANFDENSQRSRKLSAHEPRVKAFAFGDVLLSERMARRTSAVSVLALILTLHLHLPFAENIVIRGRTSLVPPRQIRTLDPHAPYKLRLSDGSVVPQCHKPPSIENAYLDLELYRNPGLRNVEHDKDFLFGMARRTSAVSVLALILTLHLHLPFAENIVIRGRTSLVPPRQIRTLDPHAPYKLRLSDGSVVPQCHKPPSIENAYLDLELYRNPGLVRDHLTLFSVGEAANYHCLPGYFAGRPYQYTIAAKCVQARDGIPYWEVRGACTKYPKCSVPPIIHDAVLSLKDSSRREFDTGERIEFACDDGFSSSLGDMLPFTTCSLSEFAADWDPVVGDCWRDGEVGDVHRKLHEANFYAEDKRVARIRAEKEVHDVAGSSMADTRLVITSWPTDEELAEDRRRRIAYNVAHVLDRQEKAFDPYHNAPPFFDEATNYEDSKKKITKELKEKYRPGRIEPTRYDKDDTKTMVHMPEFIVGGSEETTAAVKDEFAVAQDAALKQEINSVQRETPVKDDIVQPVQKSVAAGLLKKIEESSIGPKFVLHQEDSVTKPVAKSSAAKQYQVQQDSIVPAAVHMHSDEKDIQRDLRLDKLIHHFEQDHPELLNRFKYEELHNHVHQVAVLEGDLALMEADDDEDDDALEDFENYPEDYEAMVEELESNDAEYSDQPRWLSHKEGKRESKRLAHLITMQKFNPHREPKSPPIDFKFPSTEKSLRGSTRKESLSSAMPVPCDGPNCDSEFWSMEVPPAESGLGSVKNLRRPESSEEVPEKVKNIPEVNQHHKKGKSKICTGDDCDLRASWGLGKAPAPPEKGEKPELVKLLWPGRPDTGRSPDYDTRNDPDEEESFDERPAWVQWLSKPKNLVIAFVMLVACTYTLLWLRCCVKGKPCEGKLESDEAANWDTVMESGTGTATANSGSKSQYLEQFDQFEDATELVTE